jgi:hypothetical protein
MHKCSHCFKTFSSKSAVRQHGKAAHAIACHICHKVMRGRQALEDHLRTKHSRLMESSAAETKCSTTQSSLPRPGDSYSRSKAAAAAAGSETHAHGDTQSSSSVAASLFKIMKMLASTDFHTIVRSIDGEIEDASQMNQISNTAIDSKDLDQSLVVCTCCRSTCHHIWYSIFHNDEKQQKFEQIQSTNCPLCNDTSVMVLMWQSSNSSSDVVPSVGAESDGAAPAP